MPKTFMEEFETKARYMNPAHTVRDVRKTIRKAKVVKDSYTSGKMKKSNPLLYLILGGIVGQKKQLGRAVKMLIRAGVVLGIIQLFALLAVWISSLF